MVSFSRRNLIRSTAALAAASALPMPAWARGQSLTPAKNGFGEVSGEDIRLAIANHHFTTGSRSGHAVAVNGTVPGPLVRLREGQTARLQVTNNLDEDSSIHWHGLLLPFQFDGVPGVSFPGIKPGETFTYEFPVRQNGTYWWHSHSGLQEQAGHYGPIIIDSADPDPRYDRDYVVLLSEFTPMHPHEIMRKLKVGEHYFQRDMLTATKGDMSGETRRMWGKMRMNPRDISDVTGSTYTFLINGHGPQDDLQLAFQPGERVRLRVINGSAMTFFNVRIPGVPMTVIQADGQDVDEVQVDEFQIGVAETYDVIVSPPDGSHAIVAEAMDRSGMGVASLTSHKGHRATPPPLRKIPTLTMADMGMMDHSDMDRMEGMGGMDHSMRDKSLVPDDVEVGPGVDMIAPMPMDRMDFPGLGLDKLGHRVLRYTDLKARRMNPHRLVEREMEIHLTGNMERYMWSFDGKKFTAVTDDPIRFGYDERVRVKLVNQTMMAHPIHLHGHFFELVNGADHMHQPLKHTVIVQPGGTATFDLTANEPGDWAFHCHLLYHMHAGMMQVVTVRPFPEGDGA
ncbi:copper resistance system multicopper oxidase [Qipengyuania flava]|uniref:copper resistance system multicopper oxidase n=1 Tax=Qipengyuania flava TaxID=192812 RepID=UPI001C593067|nr:copper resistance system multicopper oxidase [Qipengyuania flava]MBW3169310.1 copper resistance system multicopper oxidase [Qipengyuania flava]MBY5966548.1 copper resistance system multicopper oxidase [Qipengyuania flava]MBY6012872.1 copper resistance system multicopper oxidase [Qipengyuania flava]MBY6027314.1 copper resistance system multicopper oxidase [Qipengyuania flava]